jgi:hypothetical protein
MAAPDYEPRAGTYILVPFPRSLPLSKANKQTKKQKSSRPLRTPSRPSVRRASLLLTELRIRSQLPLPRLIDARALMNGVRHFPLHFPPLLPFSSATLPPSFPFPKLPHPYSNRERERMDGADDGRQMLPKPHPPASNSAKVPCTPLPALVTDT